MCPLKYSNFIVFSKSIGARKGGRMGLLIGAVIGIPIQISAKSSQGDLIDEFENYIIPS